jgi:hypothetical protein
VILLEPVRKGVGESLREEKGDRSGGKQSSTVSSDMGTDRPKAAGKMRGWNYIGEERGWAEKKNQGTTGVGHQGRAIRSL